MGEELPRAGWAAKPQPRGRNVTVVSEESQGASVARAKLVRMTVVGDWVKQCSRLRTDHIGPVGPCNTLASTLHPFPSLLLPFPSLCVPLILHNFLLFLVCIIDYVTQYILACLFIVCFPILRWKAPGRILAEEM